MLCTGGAAASCRELQGSMYDIRSLLQQALCVLLAGEDSEAFCSKINDCQGI